MDAETSLFSFLSQFHFISLHFAGTLQLTSSGKSINAVAILCRCGLLACSMCEIV